MLADLSTPRQRRTRLLALLVALALVVAGCAEDEDEGAIAACATFKDHLTSMRDAEGREQGLRLAREAAATAEQSDDRDLADALDDYHSVIVRFALAEDDLQASQEQVAQADEAERPGAQQELEDVEERLTGLVEAGDLVLAHINAGCDEHGVTLE